MSMGLVQERRPFSTLGMELPSVPKRGDWLDVLRGELPYLTAPARPRSGRGLITHLLVRAVAEGLLVALETGAVTASLLVLPYGPLLLPFAALYGAYYGFFVGVPASAVVAGAVTVLAATRHRPLRDPKKFHREMWSVFLVAVAALAGLETWLFTGVFLITGRWAALVVALATIVLLLALRTAGRRLVVAYARASGWGP